MMDRWERISAFAGVIAAGLWIAGFIIIEGIAGEVPDGAEEILAYYQENQDTILAGSVIFLIGCVFFLWFAGILRARLLRAEGGIGTFTAIAFAGGIAFGTFMTGLPIGGMAIAIDPDVISAEAAEALENLGTAFFIGAEFSAIVLVVGTAVVTLRTAVLPKWWAYVSLILGLWLVIAPIGWAGLIFGMPLWTIVTSLILALRPTEDQAIMPSTPA